MWKGDWFSISGNKKDEHAELKVVENGRKVLYYFDESKKPWKLDCIAGEDHTFFMKTTSGKKFIFDLKINQDGREVLVGHPENNPHYKIIMHRFPES